MKKFIQDVVTIAAKDLRLEWRKKEILLTMGFFGLLSVLVLAFAFRRGDAPMGAVASGCMWVAIAFSGTLGLLRVFDREREGDSIRALLLAPTSRQAIYVAKVTSMIVFMLITELVIVPSVLFFFSLDINGARVWRIGVIAALGTIGYAAVGTLLAACLMRSMARDVLLTVVLFPLIIPVVIAGAMGTHAVIDSAIRLDDFLLWSRMLVFFDVAFVVAALWTFEALVIE